MFLKPFETLGLIAAAPVIINLNLPPKFSCIGLSNLRLTSILKNFFKNNPSQIAARRVTLPPIFFPALSHIFLYIFSRSKGTEIIKVGLTSFKFRPMCLNPSLNAIEPPLYIMHKKPIVHS